ncbi:MAG: hypothetical protein ABFQ95_00955 [Pseudomonadota bacterium]
MDIEVVEFYPESEKAKHRGYIGSMHVYVCDLDNAVQIDVRGISVFNNKGFWFFKFPARKGIDQDTKKPVNYPIFSFTDREKDKSFRKSVIDLGQEYIKKNFAEVLA